jgi:hypothetical protein
VDPEFRETFLGENLEYTLRLLVIFCTTIGVMTWLFVFYRRKMFYQYSEPELLKMTVLCPHCSAHLEDRLVAKAKRTGSYSVALVRCDCGTVSEWNMLGYPPEMIRFTVPVHLLNKTPQKK